MDQVTGQLCSVVMVGATACLATYANHDEDETKRNAKFPAPEKVGNIYLVLTRDVAAGEEVLVDYGAMFTFEGEAEGEAEVRVGLILNLND